MIFVQLADAHLDSTISRKLRLPQNKRDTLRNDIRGAVAGACELALDCRADLVLIPGDLFDYECLDRETPAFLLDLMRRLTPIPVLIAPGNHDSLRPGSPYGAASGTDWPENVHIFRSPGFETVTLDRLGATVTGIGHVHRGVTDRLLAGKINFAKRDVNLLLFHGSRDGYRPSEKEVTMPFTDAELLAQDFTYAAIGHYHSFAAIEDSSGPRAAYSGCIQGRGLDETGRKFAVVGKIEDGAVSLEQIEVAKRRICIAECDITGAQDTAALSGMVRDALQSAGVRDCDIARVRLTGAAPPDVQLDLPVLESQPGFFHVSIDPRGVEPDYDLDALSLDSAAEKLKSAFVRSMRLLADEADEDECRTIRDATYYGLYALDGRRLEPRDAD